VVSGALVDPLYCEVRSFFDPYNKSILRVSMLKSSPLYVYGHIHNVRDIFSTHMSAPTVEDTHAKF
jgi:hypothetical protein